MRISVPFHQHIYQTDLCNGIDISIPLNADSNGQKCFYAPNFKIEPVKSGDLIGEVEAGSPVIFRNIFINPH